jgi:hypothetical protein
MSEIKINWDALLFRRQFILTSDDSYKCPFFHITYNIGDKYKLFLHQDLLHDKIEYSGRLVFLLGDIYDFENPKLNNSEILSAFAGSSFEELLVKTSKYAGRFVFLFYSGDEIKMFHDASASRKIYYANVNDSVHCSSNPYLLANALQLEHSKDESINIYYNSDRLIGNNFGHKGDRTPYDEVLQLLPNHYIKVDPIFSIKRYFPREFVLDKSDKEIVQESIKMLKGFLESASHRYPLMMPITAGYDSRVLLAVSKDIKDRVFYYLNVRKQTLNSTDARLHKKMLSKLGLEFNLLHIKDDYPNEFKEMCIRNNPFIGQNFIGVFHNYLTNYANHLNLPAQIIPIINHSYKYRYMDLSFVNDFYSNWLCKFEKSEPYVKKYDKGELLFWEDYFPNRQTQLLQDKDIAQEEFYIFNSSYLLALMLSYTKKYRKSPYRRLHKEIIKELWPELLKFPFNPSFKEQFKNILIKINVYEPALKIKKLLNPIINKIIK